jgi:putative oxidoreductase
MAHPIPRSTAALGATVLRVALGIMYLAHAGLKVFTFGLAGTAQFFAAVGFAEWLVYPVVLAEIAGGAMLILGIGARWVAIALLPILAGAVWTHLPNGWVFSATGGGWEYPLFLIIASIVQALVGDDAFALRTHRTRLQRIGHAPAGVHCLGKRPIM